MTQYLRSFLSVFLSVQLLLPAQAFAAVTAPCDKPYSPANGTDQKRTYCEAAVLADKAGTAQKQTAIAWGVVTATCTTACAMAMSPAVTASEFTVGRYCKYLSIGATGFDIIKTLQIKADFQNSIKDLIGAGGMAANQIINRGVTSTTGKIIGESIGKGNKYTLGSPILKGNGSAIANHKMDNLPNTYANETDNKIAKAQQDNKKTSCFSAAIAAATTAMKYMSFKDSEKTKLENIDKAKLLEDALTAVPSPTPSSSSSPSSNLMLQSDSLANTSFDSVNGVTNVNASGSNTSSAATAGVNAQASSRASCASWSSNPTMGSFGSCATAGETELVKIMQLPEFKADVKALSGKSFEDLIKSIPNNATPEQIMAATLAKVSEPVKTKNAFAKINKGFEISIENVLRNDPAYASKPFRSALVQASNSVNAAPSLGVSEVVASPIKTEPELGVSRDLASQPDLYQGDSETIAQNSGLNIFARVEHRYKKIQPRVESVGYSLPFNQMAK